jgi:hypothetical protein
VRRLELGTDHVPIPLYGAGGRRLDLVTRLDRLKLGGLTATDATFYVTPIGGAGRDIRFAGLIGADFLAGYDVELDLADGRVSLFSQDHCKGRVVHWAKEYFAVPFSPGREGGPGRIDLDVTVDGKPVLAILDTGAHWTLMRLATSSGLFDIDTSSPGVESIGALRGIEGNHVDEYSYTFKTLVLGGITFENPVIHLAAINVARHEADVGSHFSRANLGQPDLYIGMNVIRRLHLYIAYGERMLYFTIEDRAVPEGQ